MCESPHDDIDRIARRGYQIVGDARVRSLDEHMDLGFVLAALVAQETGETPRILGKTGPILRDEAA